MSNYSDFLVGYYNDLETVLVDKGYVTAGVRESIPTISGSEITGESTSATVIITNYDSNKFYFGTVNSGTLTVTSGIALWQLPMVSGTLTANIYAVSAGKVTSNPTTKQYIRPHYGNDSYTKLMLHMDGADNGTSFVDSSSSPKTVTRYNAVTKTGVKKFGSASGYFDGSGDYLVVPASGDWSFGNGDFTIDLWFKPTASVRGYLCIYWESDEAAWALDYNYQGTRNVNIWASSNGTSWDIIHADPGGSGIGSTSLDLNTWNHIAYVRYGNLWRLFINGVKDVEVDTSGDLTTQGGAPVVIGSNEVDTYLSGYIDELRVSKGVARWTSNFDSNIVYNNGKPWKNQYSFNMVDDTLGTWTTGTSLPGVLGLSQAIVTNNRVYLLGGLNAATTDVVYTAPINSDGTLGSWTTDDPLPGVLRLSQAIVTNNRVYLLGGYNTAITDVVYTATLSGGFNNYLDKTMIAGKSNIAYY